MGEGYCQGIAQRDDAIAHKQMEERRVFQAGRIGNGQLAGGPPTTSPVVGAIGAQSDLLHEVHGRISYLEERLGLVLASPPPQGESGSTVRPTAVQIIDRLADNLQITKHAINRIENLIERLQL